MDYISIDNFEGPLDLLLHLVKSADIDICDISIEEITDKYLQYIEREKSLNIDVSSSYLVMAAELMYIKSKTLLPSSFDDESKEEDITRENLVNRLIEYKKYKELAPTFRKWEEERQEIYIKGPEKYADYVDDSLKDVVNADELIEAFTKFLQRKNQERPMKKTVVNKEYSVSERKNNIKKILQQKRTLYLDELIKENNKPYLVVTFLSILEMVKESDILIRQDRNFDKILIEARW